MSEPEERAEIGVEVAYAEPGRAVVTAFRVARGATIAQVLELAAACPEFAGIDLRRSAVGVFGRLALPNRAVEEGDRVEILRPLAIDPKAARRARAREARTKS
jgi:putative ubiquitin-RnfH superfamily antitoxin RatB of RatAB toxin-antitoxin module